MSVAVERSYRRVRVADHLIERNDGRQASRQEGRKEGRNEGKGEQKKNEEEALLQPPAATC